MQVYSDDKKAGQNHPDITKGEAIKTIVDYLVAPTKLKTKEGR